MEPFPRYWPFVREIHRSPVNSPHKGQWRGALMFSLIGASTNGSANNRDAGDLKRHRIHYNITVMIKRVYLRHSYWWFSHLWRHTLPLNRLTTTHARCSSCKRRTSGWRQDFCYRPPLWVPWCRTHNHRFAKWVSPGLYFLHAGLEITCRCGNSLRQNGPLNCWIMAYCLTKAPSHCLNQSLLIVNWNQEPAIIYSREFTVRAIEKRRNSLFIVHIDVGCWKISLFRRAPH